MISLIELNEQNQPSNSKNSIITKAIKEKIPLTFYYTGPKTPKKESVKPGYRIKGESVALGLSKKGNLIVRMYVKPPSTSKKGFDKHGWRTFMVSRMSQLKLQDNESFDLNRPLYKEGDDNSMTVTYVKSDSDSQVKKEPNNIEKTQQPQSKIADKEPTPTKLSLNTINKDIENSVNKEPTALPIPKKEIKPTSDPNTEIIINTELNKLVKTNNNTKEININDLENIKKQIYRLKEKNWRDEQLKLNKTSNTGEGTRRRLSNETNLDIENILSKNNIQITNDENLNENLKRIKTLIFY